MGGLGSFVGRGRELDRILSALDEKSGIRFIEVTGPGGIGKTTLVEEVLHRLPADVPVLALTERDPYDGPAGAMARMAERFILKFERAREFRTFFLATRLHQRLRAGGVIAKALGWILPRAWAEDPERALTDSFLASVDRFFRPRPAGARVEAPFAGRTIVFALDGYERAEPILTRWLHLTLLPRLARTHVSYEPKVIFSGREPLAARDQSWDALTYIDAMMTVPLSPLDPEAAAELLESRGIADEASREAIVRLCGGHPLWLSLAAQPAASEGENEGAGVAGGASAGAAAATRAQVVKHLERRILRWVESERERHWIRAAAHLEWFDRDALRVLLGDDAEAAYDWLVAQPSLLDPAAEKHAIEPFARNVLRGAVRLDSAILSSELGDRAEAFRRAHELLRSLPSQAVVRFVVGAAAIWQLDDNALSSLAAENEVEIRQWLRTDEATRIFEKTEAGWWVRPEVRGLLRKAGERRDRP